MATTTGSRVTIELCSFKCALLDLAARRLEQTGAYLFRECRCSAIAYSTHLPSSAAARPRMLVVAVAILHQSR